MRINHLLSASAIAAALTAAALLGPLASANAASASHLATARADWTTGAQGPAASESQYWAAARKQLAAYGTRYSHERADLAAIIAIPLTDTTATQQATETSAIRELNGFFDTPGDYGVAAGNVKALAKADWVASAHVSEAVRSGELAAARDELGSAGSRYATQRAELATLISIPLTGLTATQIRTERLDTSHLDAFFGTPGQPA